MNKDNTYIINVESSTEVHNNIIADIISSNYVTKRIFDNLFLIIASKEDNAQTIHTKITSDIKTYKIKENLGILIIKLTHYYGTLSVDVWTWINNNVDKVPFGDV